MATSPLFGWEEPDDTDLVKDGAAAIRTLGNAIDTSMGDLLGGTTSQILSKNSNTNMDFTWVTPSSGSFNKITSNTFSAVSSVSLPNSTFSSTYTNYKVVFIVSSSSGSPAMTGRYRASGSDNTGSTYYSALSIARVDGSSATQGNSSAGTSFNLGYMSSGTPGTYGLTLDFLSPQAAAKKQIFGGGFGYNSGQDAFAAYSLGAWYNNTTQFDAFSFIASTGTITGSYYVYGYAN
jgi:hypothetical protein